MPTNFTTFKIKDVFSQLLHIDGGPATEDRIVYSAVGVATALKVGTGSIAVDNVHIDGNTISTLNTNGNLILSPNGTGSVTVDNVSINTNTIATTDTNGNLVLAPNGTGAVAIANAAITGGTISGVTFSGSFSGLTLVESTTLATGAAAAGVNLNGNTLAADGTDTNIDINITPKGTGEVNITNVDILSGKVPFSTVTGRAFAAFSDITDQTGSTSAATPVKFGTTDVAGSGVTVVTDGSNLTRITFAAAGTYMVAPSLQFANSDAADHDVTIWFAVNGVNVERSATRFVVPKLGDGGVGCFQIVVYVTVTAGQYVQVLWLPENVAVTLDHTAAGAIAPAIPSAVVVTERVA